MQDRPPIPPRRKSHRINVRDQRLSISYRAFLSISAAAYNDGDSKAADYEINARLATLATIACVYDLAVSPARRGDCSQPPRASFLRSRPDGDVDTFDTRRWIAVISDAEYTNQTKKFSFNLELNIY